MAGLKPYAGFKQIAPDRYVLAGSFPVATPMPTPTSFSSGVAASAAPDRPKTAANALWPNLPA
jgi:hypothetical protein